MRKIRWFLSAGTGYEVEDEFEVEDVVTDDEVEETAKEIALGYIDWGWEEVRGESDVD